MHAHASDGCHDDALLTDLYALTMLQSYYDAAMNDVASFEFFVRALPPQRNFLMASGLAPMLDYLECLRFTDADLARLARTGRFRGDFLASLEDMHFTGSVHAMPEGTVCFADEPVVRITAPLREAQLVKAE